MTARLSSAPAAPAPTTPTDTRLDPTDGSGDHDRFAHYVPKHELTQALVEGTAVIALCGKKWIPTRDPDRFPVCPSCKEIYAGLTGGD